MENNQSNITEETKHNDNFETTHEQSQQNGKHSPKRKYLK